MKIDKTFSKMSGAGLLALMLLVACGKKDSGGGSGNTVDPNTVCNGVPSGQMASNGQLCINGVPSGPVNSGTGNLINLQFQTPHMAGALVLSTPAGAYASAATYYGAVTGGGTVQILDSSYCGAPVGVYNLVMQTAANYSGGLISGLNLLATGPGTLQMIGSYQNSIVYSGNRVQLNVQLTVNGMPCGPVVTY